MKAETIYEGQRAESQLEDALLEAGAKFERLGFDDYDNSIELYDVPVDHRLSEGVQRLLFDAGFSIIFVNHVDKWETQYRFDQRKPFEINAGWRVSYPHKRGKDERGIWVEKHVETWPQEWFDTGYVTIKQPSQGKGDAP